MSFTDFVHKYNLKNKAKSIVKYQNILSSLFLSDLGIHLKNGPYKADLKL